MPAYGEFQAGAIGRTPFMNGIARIWAGLPNSSGQSHYDGYAGNSAGMSWARYESAKCRRSSPAPRLTAGNEKAPASGQGLIRVRVRRFRPAIPHQSSRTTVRVLTGSFIAARRSASRATSSPTPSISNITRPGFTRATQ